MSALTSALICRCSTSVSARTALPRSIASSIYRISCLQLCTELGDQEDENNEVGGEPGGRTEAGEASVDAVEKPVAPRSEKLKGS